MGKPVFYSKWIPLKSSSQFVLVIPIDKMLKSALWSFILCNVYQIPEANPSKVCSTDSKTFVNDAKAAACPGDVIFEENFSGSSLDPQKWRMEKRMAVFPDYEFNTYLDNTQALSLKDGQVVLKPVKYTSIYGPQSLTAELKLRKDCTGELDTFECDRESDAISILPPFITPQFSTINSFKFRYGQVEIRAKLPSAKWVVPQVFLNPVDHKYGKGQYESGQLRVVQSKGECEIVSGAVLSDLEPFRSTKMCSTQCKRKGDWNNEFHVYTMVWLPDSIKFYVDGREICAVNPGQGLYATITNGNPLPTKELLAKNGETPLAPFDQNFYLTIGYAVGGINDFQDEPRKPWRNDDPRAMNKFWKKNRAFDYGVGKYMFTIDYVKIYAV